MQGTVRIHQKVQRIFQRKLLEEDDLWKGNKH